MNKTVLRMYVPNDIFQTQIFYLKSIIMKGSSLILGKIQGLHDSISEHIFQKIITSYFISHSYKLFFILKLKICSVLGDY